MDAKIVPLEAEEKNIRKQMRINAENWIGYLGEACSLRIHQQYEYRLLTAPEIRSAAKRIGPLLADPLGIDSAPVYRAVGALITMGHPVVLAMLLAGISPMGEVKARRRCRGAKR